MCVRVCERKRNNNANVYNDAHAFNGAGAYATHCAYANASYSAYTYAIYAIDNYAFHVLDNFKNHMHNILLFLKVIILVFNF